MTLRRNRRAMTLLGLVGAMLAADPAAPAYGPPNAFHHWGEPRFGYYVSDDRWVIRRHAQLLADASIDVIFFDVTNARAYLPTLQIIAEEFTALRAQGRTTPAISFLLHSNTPKVAGKLFTEFYQANLHRDLWFIWKGKPLILANPAELTPAQRDFFSVRESWAWTKGKPGAWFNDGKDKWPWIDHTPQGYGWHEAPDKPEQITVAAAQHPIANIGRSFHDGKQPAPGEEQPGVGLFFAEQWERALAVDPEFVFVTGWNEWVAMRFIDGRSKQMLGKPIQKGETFFVDAYNAEFSRDLEPMRGGFGDNYYLQLVSQVRRYKGARPAPVATTPARIVIDGRFSDWANVTAIFHDDVGDTSPRDHFGWGRIGRYENRSGRNDLVLAKVACDATTISFYLETKNSLGGAALPAGLTLWLKTATGDFAVNRTDGKGLLERRLGPATWEAIQPLTAAITGHQIEFALPRAAIGSSEANFTLEFKWTDACDIGSDPMLAYEQGDAAPNGRFFTVSVSEVDAEFSVSHHANVSAAGIPNFMPPVVRRSAVLLAAMVAGSLSCVATQPENPGRNLKFPARRPSAPSSVRAGATSAAKTPRAASKKGSDYTGSAPRKVVALTDCL